jgi:hypothetical protein
MGKQLYTDGKKTTVLTWISFIIWIFQRWLSKTIITGT